MSETPSTIDALLQENREFPPPVDFSKNAVANDPELYARASKDPEAFWESMAKELHWFEPFKSVLDWSNPPFARWFEGGKTNLSTNCLDRHLDGLKADKEALIWEGELGDVRRFTYRELHAEVCRAANALKALGIEKGDLVQFSTNENEFKVLKRKVEKKRQELLEEEEGIMEL